MGLGIGDLGLGVGGWAQTPNPQSPIPNPQSPIPTYNIKSLTFYNKFYYSRIFSIIIKRK